MTLVQAPPSHLDNWSPCPLRQATGLFLKSKPTTPPLISKLSRRYPGYIYWLSRSCPMVPCLQLPTCQPAHCVPATWTFCPASDMPSSFPPQGFCICRSVGFTSSHPGSLLSYLLLISGPSAEVSLLGKVLFETSLPKAPFPSPFPFPLLPNHILLQ